MQMPGRVFTGSEEYRYGFNGMEKDDEVSGEGNSYTTLFRQNDPRIGRWWSIDHKANALESPYISMGGNPIWFNDPYGDTFRVSSVDLNMNEEDDKKQFDQYMGMMNDQFSGKVNFDTEFEGAGEYSNTGLSVKDGESLRKEEQARFDHLSGLATQKEDFNVGLSNENGFPNGNNFVNINYPNYDATFNMPLLSKIPENKAGFGKDQFVYFGMTGGNTQSFNAGSTFQLESYEHRPNQIGFFNNYAKTIIHLENGSSNYDRVIFSTKLLYVPRGSKEKQPRLMSKRDVKVKAR
tara:strand:+ start:1204 stop:2082 length:879 start_codon:yes stop_codon:yes gene_type:complete